MIAYMERRIIDDITLIAIIYAFVTAFKCYSKWDILIHIINNIILSLFGQSRGEIICVNYVIFLLQNIHVTIKSAFIAICIYVIIGRTYSYREGKSINLLIPSSLYHMILIFGSIKLTYYYKKKYNK